MPRLFDAYIIVDWSAAAKPTTGANSIWVGVRARDARLKFQFTSVNPKTRLEARQFIGDMIEKLNARGDKVLVGFDFAMGYPAGTSAAANLLKSDLEPWRAMYAHLYKKVKEKPDNSNARFAIAAGLNYAMTQGPHPFWGVTRKDEVSTLAPKKGDFTQTGSLAEHRRAEDWIKANFKARPKSVWQLLGAGSVGSQALLGIPTVQALRDRIENSQIWPFETGFKALNEEDLENVPCVFAEIYPSTLQITPKAGQTTDEAQVEALAEHLETLDSAGKLCPAFGPPEALKSEEILQIQQEEGWILAK